MSHTSKIKVLWILPGEEASKVNMNFARRTVPALNAAGVEVDCFYLSSRTNPKQIFKLWREIKKKIKLERYNAVHAQYGTITGFLATCLGMPTIVTFRGSDVNGDPARSRLHKWITWSLSALASIRAKKSIFVSAELAANLSLKGEWTCLPSPLDLNHFQPLSREASLEKLGLVPSVQWIAFVTSGGRKVKRQELAEETIALLKARGLKVELLVIQNVDPAEVPLWLNSARCLLFTSLREGSPNAVREALACGLPVVSVRVGDVERWIGKDPFSKLVETGSAVELANAVEAALAAPHTRRVDLSEVSYEHHVMKLKAIYESASRTKSKRSS